MRVQLTHDTDLLTEIVTHPDVWPHLIDDAAPRREDYRVTLEPDVFYLTASDDAGGPIGALRFDRHNAVTWELHTAVLPQHRGATSGVFGHAGLRWMFENAGARKIITQVPADNERALRYAHRLGFRDEGINRASFLKGGALLDQTMLGITEGELCLG